MPYLPGQRPPVSRPKRIRERKPREPVPVSHAPSVQSQLDAIRERLTKLERGVRWAVSCHILTVKTRGLDR